MPQKIGDPWAPVVWGRPQKLRPRLWCLFLFKNQRVNVTHKIITQHWLHYNIIWIKKKNNKKTNLSLVSRAVIPGSICLQKPAFNVARNPVLHYHEQLIESILLSTSFAESSPRKETLSSWEFKIDAIHLPSLGEKSTFAYCFQRMGF